MSLNIQVILGKSPEISITFIFCPGLRSQAHLEPDQSGESRISFGAGRRRLQRELRSPQKEAPSYSGTFWGFRLSDLTGRYLRNGASFNAPFLLWLGLLLRITGRPTPHLAPCTIQSCEHFVRLNQEDSSDFLSWRKIVDYWLFTIFWVNFDFRTTSTSWTPPTCRTFTASTLHSPFDWSRFEFENSSFLIFWPHGLFQPLLKLFCFFLIFGVLPGFFASHCWWMMKKLYQCLCRELHL